MLRYGSDKPDLRFGLEIADVGDLAAQTEFQVFRSTLEAGGKVRGLNATAGAEKFSRKGLDELGEQVKRSGAKGLAWIKVEADKLTSPIEKFLPAGVQQSLRQRMGAEAGDLLLLVADREALDRKLAGAREHQGRARREVTDLRGSRRDDRHPIDVGPARREFQIDSLGLEVAEAFRRDLADLTVAHDPAELERHLARGGARTARDGDDATGGDSGEQRRRAAEHVAAGQFVAGGCPAHISSLEALLGRAPQP